MPSNSFVNVCNDPFSRVFGGSTAGAADIYVSGYSFISFSQLPGALSEYARAVKNNSNDAQIGDNIAISRYLSGACLSCTPPGMTINKTEVTGLGGLKFVTPTNTDFGNTVTMKFLEYSSLPTLSIFSGWARLIREYRNGASNLVGDAYTKQNYVGTCFYWTTKPDGVTVEFASCFTGMWPTKDPQDSFSGDLSSVDKLELDIEFNIDMSYRETWVYEECRKQALEFKLAGMTRRGSTSYEMPGEMY